MYVRCVTNKLDISIIINNNYLQQFELEQNISVGKIYLVLGINIFFKEKHYGNGIYIQILNDNYLWRLLPIEFFEIIDEKLSIYWKIKRVDKNEVAIMPNDFYKAYYFDDLTEMVPEIVNNFRENYIKIKNEFNINME